MAWSRFPYGSVGCTPRAGSARNLVIVTKIGFRAAMRYCGLFWSSLTRFRRAVGSAKPREAPHKGARGDRPASRGNTQSTQSSQRLGLEGRRGRCHRRFPQGAIRCLRSDGARPPELADEQSAKRLRRAYAFTTRSGNDSLWGNDAGSAMRRRSPFRRQDPTFRLTNACPPRGRERSCARDRNGPTSGSTAPNRISVTTGPKCALIQRGS